MLCHLNLHRWRTIPATIEDGALQHYMVRQCSRCNRLYSRRVPDGKWLDLTDAAPPRVRVLLERAAEEMGIDVKGAPKTLTYAQEAWLLVRMAANFVLRR